jgi:transcriptional regulator with XRE-family HTH domain
MRTKLPNQTDVTVGHNIRMCRQHARMSQTELGEQIGVTFQQVQKYEKGVNRVGAGRLVQIANALNVRLPTLFDGVKETSSGATTTPLELIDDAAALKLLEAFADVSDSALRRAIVHLVAQLAAEPSRPKRSASH